MYTDVLQMYTVPYAGAFVSTGAQSADATNDGAAM